MRTDRATGTTLLAILAVAAVAYAPSLEVPFQFDDYARISSNWNLHQGNWLRGIGQLGGVRVLPATSLALNFWLSGDDTTGYHVVNLLIHLLATAAVFWLGLLLARTRRLRGSAIAEAPLFFAACAAALFACHPLQTQAVTYIVQRFASMAALFYVASVAAYVSGRLAQEENRPRARPRFAAALGFALAALLSKENAVTLPLAVVLVEVAFFGRRGLGALARRGMWLLPVLAVPVAWKWYAWRTRRGVEVEGGPLRQLLDALFAQGGEGLTVMPPLDYLQTQMLVLPRYLKLLVLPVGLNVDHDIGIATSIDAAAAAGALFLIGLLAVGVYLLRSHPALGFAVLWFFVTLSIESSVIPIHDVMMEHRMYLAMPGVAVGFAALLCQWRVRDRRSATAGAVAIVLVLAGLTFARNQVWQSALSLWSDAAAKSPNKARVHVNLGVAHHVRDELDQAIASYCRAIALDDDIPVARDNIEIALEQQGRLDEAIERLKPKPVEVPNAPEGAIILEYDFSEAVCPR